MKAAWKVTKYTCLALLALVVAGIVAPMISAERYRPRIQAAIEGALGRKVELRGALHFNVFTGVGFAVDDVVIHEDPSIGIEPIAYVTTLEAVPRVWSLFRRKLEFSSIRLDAASINVAKTGTPSGPGRWNFEPLLTRSLVTAFPEIHIRGGRINFKFGDTKAVFYLTETDLDISPPSIGGNDWNVRFSGGPARTDRPSRAFGSLEARGRWTAPERGRPDRLNLEVQLERSGIGDITALVRGADAGIHGSLSSRMRLTGPLDDIQIAGRIVVEDVHRWDLLPPHGENWPMGVRGRLNLVAQTLELETSSSEREALPLAVRLNIANYLSEPRTEIAVAWHRFPLAPVLELARHMGARLPPHLKLSGTLDGTAGYDGRSGLRGEMAFHDTAVTIEDSPPIRFEQARLQFDPGGMRLTPAVVKTHDNDEARIEASYRWDGSSLELAISTAGMKVASLREQAALAAVPWLEQLSSGVWSGDLHYRYSPPESEDEPPQIAWTGALELKGAEFTLPGLAEPVLLEQVHAQIQGRRVVLDRMQARAGKVTVQGDYRYEPQLARPHRFRLTIAEADAAELERLFAPTLRRHRGLLARAFNIGRAPLPEWLATRRMEGTVQVGALTLAGTPVQRLRGRMVWDGTRIRLDNLSAHAGEGTVAGALTVNLRGPRPAYLLTGRAKAVSYLSGKLDAEGVLETRGTGAELLANLRSTGLFTGRSLELGPMHALRTVSGAYGLAWAQPEPRLRFWDLQLASGEDVWTGAGATQEDGRLLIQLSGGGREMRMRGTLAKLRVDENPVP